jgi:hypothetical protein
LSHGRSLFRGFKTKRGINGALELILLISKGAYEVKVNYNITISMNIYLETEACMNLDMLAENKLPPILRFIEIIKVFEIFGIIADIKLIHETYLIFTTTVKSESRRM